MMDWTNEMNPTMTAAAAGGANSPSSLDDFTEFLFSTNDYPEDDVKPPALLSTCLSTASDSVLSSICFTDLYGEGFTNVSDLLAITPMDIMMLSEPNEDQTSEPALSLTLFTANHSCTVNTTVLTPSTTNTVLTPSTTNTALTPSTTNTVLAPLDHSYSTVKLTVANHEIHERNHYDTIRIEYSDDDNDDEDDDDDIESVTCSKATVKRKETAKGAETVGVSKELMKRKKYLERRMKNNIASKRSREIRKNKFVSMDEQARDMEHSNEELRRKIDKLEEITRKMKDALVRRLANTKC